MPKGSGLSSTEKMKLSRELVSLRKQGRTASGLAAMKAARRIDAIMTQLGRKAKSKKAERSGLDDLLAGKWNHLDPKPFIKAVGELVTSNSATLDAVKPPVIEYLAAKGVLSE